MQVSLHSCEINDLPVIRRIRLETLQVNLGYRCNQQCAHCHVNAGPQRKEMMDRATVEQVVAYLERSSLHNLDLTGGAPEINPYFKDLVHAARGLGVHVIDRCNLTILEEAGHEGLPEFLADHQVEVMASLPCYLKENVDRQRGNGVFEVSIRVLKRLNELGYGQEGSGLLLNLVHNPLGPFLPPPQRSLEDDYRKELGKRYGIVFNHLYTLTNMPIQRFGDMLTSEGQLQGYMDLLQKAHQYTNLDSVMCRSMINVDWRGYIYDCDFNQILGLPLSIKSKRHVHLTELMGVDLDGHPITFWNHCYGCTAGQGSSCCGALR